MFKQFLNSNLKGQIIVVALLLLFVVISVFGRHLTLYTTPLQGPVYAFLAETIGVNSIITKVFVLVMLIGSGFLFNELFKIFRLLPKHNYTILMLWLFYLLIFPSYLAFTPQLLASTVILYVIFQFFKFSVDEFRLSDLITINLMFSIVSLIYKPLVFYIVFMPVALILLRQFNLRFLLVSLLSFSVPYLYLWAYYFLGDNSGMFAGFFDFNFYDFDRFKGLFQDKSFFVPAIIAVFIFVFAFFKMFISLQSKLIQTRIIMSFIIGFLLFTVLIITALPDNPKYDLFLLYFSSIAIQALGFMELKKAYAVDILFALIFFVSIFLNYL